MSELMGKKYYDEINIARGIAVLLVLLGHAFPDILSQSGNVFHKVTESILYSFHMGCFFFLSGFVGSRKITSGNINVKNEFINKFKRLMIPYLFYSFITMGLKQIFQAFANNSFEISEFWKILLGKNPNGGLWYLWTLFVIAMIFALLSKIKIKCVVYIALGIILYAFLYFIPQGFYSNLLKYFIFYAVGIYTANDYDKIKPVLATYPFGVLCLILFGAGVYIEGVPYALTGLLGTGLVMFFSIKATENKGVMFNFLNETGNYSYDIYLISYFVQIPIRIICYKILNLPYLIVVTLMFVLGGVIPYFACKYIIRKIPLTNKILLGNWK